VSGFSLSFGRALTNRVGGRDRRLGRLDYGIAAAFGEDVPCFTEVHFVGFLGGDPHGPPLVDLGLALAVVLGYLADLAGQFRLVAVKREAEDFQGLCFGLPGLVLLARPG
jgi:hypothetical protein